MHRTSTNPVAVIIGAVGNALHSGGGNTWLPLMVLASLPKETTSPVKSFMRAFYILRGIAPKRIKTLLYGVIDRGKVK